LPDNGNYVLAGQQHSFARPNVAGWTDYTVQTRIKLVNGSLHLSVRENTGGGHIRYFIGVSLDKIWLSKQIKDDFFDLDQRGQAIGLDKWYTVKAVLQGNNVKVYLDDKVLIDYTDHENPILSGSFSFETSLGESLAYFDDVSVRVSQAEYSPTPVSTASVTFPDRNLDEAVRSALEKQAGEEITAADLANLSRVDAGKRGITDLTGIQYCINLDGIELQENQINDISALSSLSKLTLLALHENQISDISALSSLTNLIELYIDENQISDITVLSSMTMLRELHASGNQISDVSALSSLTSLIELWIIANQITDISPLSTLTNLTDLQLKYNRISDISTLASLTNLSFLDLDFNRISDIQPLVANSGLSAGDRVSLRGNPLSSESLNVYIPQLEQRGVIVTIK
jgi:Leucine-rich repeat (LRR) protein